MRNNFCLMVCVLEYLGQSFNAFAFYFLLAMRNFDVFMHSFYIYCLCSTRNCFLFRVYRLFVECKLELSFA